ncbi:bifunctional 5,10-methylenetetrahydrofolate dehydrogenase/5,10-methenyltetrahydrofolate cyclohydrolase [Ferruginivarius sediminum]|uniref:Bifunctional protein FolD n=1 Tax=Ferruginivarius sediminum TaxID=2661937 RepID=A0A369T5U8_9PROT|nr:bifunctional 5,10-methylenetetrahydrofolate dehydrogenase/5,10-methenyltetrahydrofolate cyclohydrolase [Ferruginivarius sediminum]RDD60648.1 bifunctional 5,10-methylenetetrahydrofolate dehydrogenase/5,10-methenyltetrahydrofolate cyclohydrolase [Ferruginivarius sediminum]
MSSATARQKEPGKDHKILNGRAVGQSIREKVADKVAALKDANWHPRLVSIAIGAAEPAKLYIRNQRRVADKLGINFDDRHYGEETTREEMLAAIAALNADPSVTGILIQRPVPKHLSIKELQAAVHPLKDVEGMHPASIGNIVYNDLILGPCTAVAAVEMLKATGLALPGLEVVVVGHSEIVGKPIAFLLMSEGATVTVCHHMTRNLTVHLRRADAVFVAVGKPQLITGQMIKPGAALIDIGINQIQAEDGSSKVVGDADYETCHDVAGWITPVPGGVGPVTVSILMRNVAKAAELQKRHYEKQYGEATFVADA